MTARSTIERIVTPNEFPLITRPLRPVTALNLESLRDASVRPRLDVQRPRRPTLSTGSAPIPRRMRGSRRARSRPRGAAQQGLSRHDATSGFTSRPSMTRPSRPPDDLSGWPRIVPAEGRLPDSLCVRQPDLPARDAGHDRRLHQPRPQARSERSRAPSDWGDRTNNRRVEYNALDDKYSQLIIDELLPTLKRITISRQTPETARSPGPARGRSARSPSPGTGPTSSARSSARSAASPTSWAAMSIPT